MQLTWIDMTVFVGFMAIVVIVSLYAGRRERDTQDYFLAGRSLGPILIGFSLIASNISTEHFVGMAGSAFGDYGLAVAAYEWMAAITLVFVAWWFLPRFLSAGIYTMPEYLEYRYDRGARTIMALLLMIAYIVVFLATVVYSGAVALNTIFDVPRLFETRFGLDSESAQFWAMVSAVWLIGIIAGSYTIYGGLKAVVWSDLLQGGALLLGGATVAVLGLYTIGEGSVPTGWTRFVAANDAKLHAVLPWNHPDLPWIAIFVGGLWIPNLFYWGLNQFITQRTLAARSLAKGQMGIFIAAGLKLLIPFIIVLPGIMAWQLYGTAIANGDSAYPHMIKNLLPPSLRGVMFAALAGAVMSSFNSGVNSAATIFTIDLYSKYIDPKSTPENAVRVGRVATGVIVVLACLWAPMISRFGGVFKYIQEIWGFITPGIVAAFLGGMLLKKAPPMAAKVAMLFGIVLYALCRVPGWIITEPQSPLAKLIHRFSTMTFLHHMFIIFWLLFFCMAVIAMLKPLTHPVEWPRSEIDVTPHPRRYLYGGAVIALTAVCYIMFW